MINAYWKNGTDFIPSLLELQHTLRKWNKEVFGDILKRKVALSIKLKDLEKQNDQANNPSLIQEENKTREDLERTLWEEEVLWVQKSRANFITSGDCNTHFFHVATLARRRQNKILRLQDDEGRWIEDPDILRNMAKDFYCKLFMEEELGQILIPAFFATIESDRLKDMAPTPPIVEWRHILWSMGGLKAPGKNGFHA
ncbi:unnamed protein product [Linum trigynum]|uniref:Reverse transcriptase n=1 Tax=Linum trigynum TaxID=586398 RepID=A0AAV2GMD0_9ROSI